MNETIPQNIYQRYFQSLLKGERSACYEIVNNLIQERILIKILYLELFQRSLYEIGDLWERNKISVAVEHMATAITESLMHLVYPVLFAQDTNGKVAIVTSSPNEYHQIGGRMVADILRYHGWDSLFLGSNVPYLDLKKMIDENVPDLLAVSLSVYFNINIMIDIIKGVRENYPDVPVIFGGLAFMHGGKERLEAMMDVTYVPTLDELEKYIQRF